MEEKDRILQEAREEAERIINEAKETAEEIKATAAKSSGESYDEFQQRLKQSGFKLRTEHELWKFDWLPEGVKKDKALLKDNLKRQKEIVSMSYISAVNWKEDPKAVKPNCKTECMKKNAFRSPKLKVSSLAVGYFEEAFEHIRRDILKNGLDKSISYLMELKSDVESAMNTLWFKPSFKDEYIALKAEEIRLRYKLETQAQQAKEELRRKKELAREEAKAQKEFEREIRKAKADEDNARKALEKAQLEAAKEAANEKRFAKLQEQIEKLKAALKEAEERGQRIMSMAQQTRRGWVYIISNIGSFGEGVYKIGLTRRLDPMERVYELGDASVPFPFDVHAFIFSEDAPALETALHQAFDRYKVNTVNWRKEYFKVPLDKIKDKVKELGYDVEFEDYAYAPQFRDSILK